jgi:hypothetical protein
VRARRLAAALALAAGVAPHAAGAPTVPAVVELSSEMRERAGLEMATLEVTELAPEAKAYGRVLDPAPLVALVYERAAAQASLDASAREHERVEGLHRSGDNASAREFEAAQAAWQRDLFAVASAEARLVSAWGQVLAQRPDLPELARSLAARSAALARVDLPVGEGTAEPPTGGRLTAFPRDDVTLESTWLGPAPTADPMLQGRGFLFLLPSHPPPPGTAVVGWLRVPGAARRGVVVPRPALVHHEGEVFVYVERAPDRFERRRVVLEGPEGDGWFVSSGVAAGDRVVVTGAQQLLSSELLTGGESED